MPFFSEENQCIDIICKLKQIKENHNLKDDSIDNLGRSL